MLMKNIGIRAETKSDQEHRSPLTPHQVLSLLNDFHIATYIEPSEKRAFSDDEFSACGAVLDQNFTDCPVILGVKEIPVEHILPEKIYLIFSHTVKGQPENMPMLKEMLKQKCTLIDYEKIVDEKGRRLVFFGRFAGYAGMIESLAVFGKRLALQQINTPFAEIPQAWQYDSLDAAKIHLAHIAEKLRSKPLPQQLYPFVCGFAGYGNVSAGAQEILDIFDVHEISPHQLLTDSLANGLFKTIFRESDMVVSRTAGADFNLAEYYAFPERYIGDFQKYLSSLSILINGIYWEDKYPRLVTKKALAESAPSKLQVIGDISCDLNGAIEITEKTTTFARPAFVYDYQKGSTSDKLDEGDVAVVAIDHLPSEFPKDASYAFGKDLISFIPLICNADLNQDFNELALPGEIKNAIIVYQGHLTPHYQYLEHHVRNV